MRNLPRDVFSICTPSSIRYTGAVEKLQGGGKLVAARNWCLAEEMSYAPKLQPQSSGREAIQKQKTYGAILYTLRVEDPAKQAAPPQEYTTICPLYINNPLSELVPCAIPCRLTCSFRVAQLFHWPDAHMHTSVMPTLCLQHGPSSRQGFPGSSMTHKYR